LLFAVVGLAALLANTPPPHGMPGHAGHAMMAMIIANDGRFLKREGTAWQSGKGIAARSKSVS
jgi:hypothetical protein